MIVYEFLIAEFYQKKWRKLIVIEDVKKESCDQRTHLMQRIPWINKGEEAKDV